MDVTFEPGENSDLTLFFGANDRDDRFQQSWSGYEVKFGGPGLTHQVVKRYGRRLAEAAEPIELAPGEPYHLTVERVDERVRVLVNDQVVVDIIDNDPIGDGAGEERGTVGMLLWHMDGQVDNFSVSQPGGTNVPQGDI